MIDLQHTSAAQILEVRLTGTLVADDYARIVPDIERRIRDVGKLRLLVIMHDFHGWNAGALWEDLKFDVRHFADIDRLALVGETRVAGGDERLLSPVHHRARPIFSPHGNRPGARVARSAITPSRGSPRGDARPCYPPHSSAGCLLYSASCVCNHSMTHRRYTYAVGAER